MNNNNDSNVCIDEYDKINNNNNNSMIMNEDMVNFTCDSNLNYNSYILVNNINSMKYYKYEDNIIFENENLRLTNKQISIIEKEYASYSFEYIHKLSSNIVIEEMYKSKFIILDTRSNYEYKKNHINGAINFPIDKINKSDFMFNEYVRNNHQYYKYLFNNSEHYELLIYDDHCNCNCEWKLDSINKWYNNMNDFEFLLFKFILDSYDISNIKDEFKRLLLLSNIEFDKGYGKRWRQVYFLEGGFNKFKLQHPKHCTSIDNDSISSDRDKSNLKKYQEYEIINNKLYLGNEGKIRIYIDNNKLDPNIKCIIDVRKKGSIEFEIPKGIRYIRCYSELVSNNILQLILSIEQCEKNWKIYVFCETGYGSSVAIIIGYLMKKEKKDLKTVFSEVYESLRKPIIFTPDIFYALSNREILVHNLTNENDNDKCITNCSLPIKFWYLSPYYELSISKCIELFCKPILLNNNYKNKCVIS
jgi:rhodanese-related sulfurtransferase